MDRIPVILLLLFSVLHLYGQSFKCGSNLGPISKKETEKLNYILARDKTPSVKGNIIDSVALTIHIVASNAPGYPPITEVEVETQIALANQVFADAGIEFFICGTVRHLEGGPIFNFSTGAALNRLHHVPNTVNIYFVDDIIAEDSGPLCGFAEFPFWNDPSDRYIMMNRACSTNGITLTHELGHFYGLFHTHETQFGPELANRSNCSEAGDRICDTAADPNLATPGVMSGCHYIGTATDQLGSTYRPPVSNLMSYAPPECRRSFSRLQLQTIQDIHQHENAYLTGNCDFYPDFAIHQNTELIRLGPDRLIDVSYQFRQINLDRNYDIKLRISLADQPDDSGWLLHEKHLILEPDEKTTTLSFTLNFPVVKGNGRYVLRASVDSDRQVVERTEKNNNAFTTIEVDNSNFQIATIFPSLASEKLQIFIRDDEAPQELGLRIFRYNGSLTWSDKAVKTQEEFFHDIDVSQLEVGFYLLLVDYEKSARRRVFKFFKQ